MKAVTDNKYQNTMAWPKSIAQKFLPLHEIPERLRKTLDTQNALALFLPMRWSDSNLDYNFNLK